MAIRISIFAFTLVYKVFFVFFVTMLNLGMDKLVKKYHNKFNSVLVCINLDVFFVVFFLKLNKFLKL